MREAEENIGMWKERERGKMKGGWEKGGGGGGAKGKGRTVRDIDLKVFWNKRQGECLDPY